MKIVIRTMIKSRMKIKIRSSCPPMTRAGPISKTARRIKSFS